MGGYPDGFGGPAANAALPVPGQMARDLQGNIYIVTPARILRMSPAGQLTVAAGSGVRGGSGDNGPATEARITTNYVGGIVVDSQGNVIFADSGSSRIRRIALSGTITTIAGTGTAGFSGDRGPASAAQLNGPEGLALDSKGNLYVGDYYNNRVRRIAPGSTITTVAGSGTYEKLPPATAARPRRLPSPTPGALAIDSGRQPLPLR